MPAEVMPTEAPTAVAPATNLSENQLTVWAGQVLRPASSLYQIPFTFTIDGRIDSSRFIASFESLVAGCDALRFVLDVNDGLPSRRVLDEMSAPIRLVDLSTEMDPLAAAGCWVEERRRGPLDLSRRSFESALLRLGETRWQWYLNLHHWIGDLGSISVIFQRMQDLYDGTASGSPQPPANLPSFAELIARERKERLDGGHRQAEAYWRRVLAQDAEPLALYGASSPGMSTRASRVNLHLGRERTLRLQQIAARDSAPPGSVHRKRLALLSSILYAYLYRISGKRDLTVAMPFHGRRSRAARQTVGLLMQVFPIRMEIGEAETFESLEHKVAETVAEALEHSPAALRNPIRSRAYEAELNYVPLSFSTFQDMPVRAEWIDTEELDDSLAVQILDLGATGDLQTRLVFNAECFDVGQQHRAAAHFERLLDACLTDPRRPIDSVDLLPPEERVQVLAGDRRAEASPATQTTVDRLITERAATAPKQLAIVDGRRSLTYAQLAEQSSRLAEQLRSLGAGPGQVIGMCARRSLEAVVGLVGILKSGAAYLPLDPEAPHERNLFMLSDSRVRVVLADGRGREALRGGAARILPLESSETRPRPEAARASGPRPEDLAYVMYTSGSAGVPKAVLVEHRSLSNLGAWAADEFGLGPSDRYLQFASLVWDTSLEEVVPCLLSGASLVIRPEVMADSYQEFLRHCRLLGITVLNLPTGFWHGLTDFLAGEGQALPQSIRLVIVGGEAASAQRVKLWKQHVPPVVRLVNTYGLTEATAVATMGELNDYEPGPPGSPVPIGKPIPGMAAYVLDRELRPLPFGVDGEVCLSGVGLARGYVDRPEVTAGRFVNGPLPGFLGDRLLKTGDAARLLPDGGLVYTGRLDDQVKIRGIRVEPAEVEARLCRHPGVQETAVVAWPLGGEADARLVAYLIPVSSAVGIPPVLELRSFLRESLPEYMVPSTFVEVEALPRTPSGKIDRRRLPEPPPLRPRTVEVAAPHDALEMQLVAVWEATLGVRPLGVDDDFFDLGGDSLLAVRLFSALEKATGIRVPLATLFEAPTIHRLAQLLRGRAGREADRALVPIQVSGPRTPLFCVHWMGGNVLVYRNLALHLGPDQPLYGLQAVGLDGRARPHTRVEDMARHYLQEIRRVQPAGPYNLAGASMGGKVAYEMAQQLQSQGEQVGLVALFDTRGETDELPVPIQSRVRYHASRLQGRSLGGMANYLIERVVDRTRRAAYALLIRAGLPLPSFMRDLKETTFLAARIYRPRPYAGRVVLFRASQTARGSEADSFLGWDRVALEGFESHEIPGDHVTLMKEPGVRFLAWEVKRYLDRAGHPG